jgi:transcriptional regulator with XRE-family HTH domain
MEQEDMALETFGSRLKRIREIKGLSQGELAEESGVDRSYISKLESGVTLNPTGDIIKKLAKPLNVSLDIIMGVCPIPEPKKETTEELLEKLRLAAPVSIPVYDRFYVHAGAEHAEIMEYVYRAREKAAGENIEAFIVHGHCLTPRVGNGDIVITDRERAPEPGNILLCLKDDELVVGIYQVRDGIPWLTNHDEEISLAGCRAQAVVIEVIRRTV